MKRMSLAGRLVTGAGQGASFTRLEWARQRFVEVAGIDPYPGTLNLHIDTADQLARWLDLTALTGCLVESPDADTCDARCYPIRIAGRLPGAVVVPQVPDYPETQVEIICALPLREHLSIGDGDRLEIELNRPLSARAILFDADGTLVDSVDAFHIVAERAAAGHGYPVARAAVLESLNTPGGGFWELVVPDTVSGRAAVIDTLRRTAFELWDSVLLEHVRMFPNLEQTLDTLHQQEFRLGIVTGSDGRSLQPLKDNGLIDRFDTVITAWDSDKRKPHPDSLLQAADNLGIRADEAVYVGDTAIDVRASRAAGMASIAVLTGAGDSALLSAEEPDRIVASLNELPAVLQFD